MQILPHNLKAVLFDLDGVLVNSAKYHIKAWQQVLKNHNLKEIPEIEFLLREGEKAKETFRLLVRKHNPGLSNRQINMYVKEKKKLYQGIATRGLRPEARKAVELCLQKGYKTAIVTGSRKSNIKHVLEKDERMLFHSIIHSKSSKKGKPHPDPYLKATKRLHLSPQECLVIENAPLGIQSARAAGMTCIAITTTLPEDNLKEAHLIIPDLDHLDSLIQPMPKEE